MASKTNSVKSSSNKSSSDSLDMFPSDGEERTLWPTWSYKSQALFMGKSLDMYLEKPLFKMPTLQGGEFKEEDDVEYIMPDAATSIALHKQRSAKVFGMLVQSLNEKQVKLIRDIKLGNAYAVWQRLHANYGTIVSAASNHSLKTTLSVNEKLKHESFPDYFARADRS